MTKEPMITVSISGLPKSLRDELDKLAKAERRDRSSQIVKMLEDALRERKESAKQFSKAA